jgi:hypothetical protein
LKTWGHEERVEKNEKNFNGWSGKKIKKNLMVGVAQKWKRSHGKGGTKVMVGVEKKSNLMVGVAQKWKQYFMVGVAQKWEKNLMVGVAQK